MITSGTQIEVMKTTPLLLAFASAMGGLIAMVPAANAATTYLVLGSYKQPDGGSKPRVAQYSSPSVQILPMESVEQCEAAGRRITNKIYKPIWYFDGRWTCVEGK
jgi:hypothetical protein